ncbi:hypothetical protein BDA99DRAFT_575204 [Phascolomyces articulosus]|uniref:Uncharacterized protein n=1 Tax=Phascolomyces articulosus TaxID=60185 RepID=A0AAD5PA85_9FUNG|nr:hypothetical protein BDA99DRAFT_575204 [Phascolomyces articulosus]
MIPNVKDARTEMSFYFDLTQDCVQSYLQLQEMNQNLDHSRQLLANRIAIRLFHFLLECPDEMTRLVAIKKYIKNTYMIPTYLVTVNCILRLAGYWKINYAITFQIVVFYREWSWLIYDDPFSYFTCFPISKLEILVKTFRRDAIEFGPKIIGWFKTSLDKTIGALRLGRERASILLQRSVFSSYFILPRGLKLPEWL